MKVVCINYLPAASFIPQAAEKETTSREELGDSVFRMIRYHDHSIRSVARTWKIRDVDAFALYLEAERRHERRIEARAFRAGKLAVMPPVMAARVAA